MRLVKNLRSGDKADLPAGLYELSTVMEDGQRRRKLVHIRPNQDIDVELGSTPISSSALDKIARPLRIDVTKSLHLPDSPLNLPDSSTATQSNPNNWSTFTTNDGIAVEVASTPTYSTDIDSWLGNNVDLAMQSTIDAELISCSGVEVVDQRGSNWHFAAESTLNKVATATVSAGGRTVQISLPCSAQYEPANLCVVDVEKIGGRLHANAWVAPKRTVASAMQNMLTSGHMFKALELAEDANELLLHKYEDATAAALGGIILQKAGRLANRIDWVANLAHSFDWMPDGKALLAHLYATTAGHQTQARELAIEASQQRFLYTESFSLLLELLRRWPDRSDDAELQAAMRRLTNVSAYVDWNSVCFTQLLPDEES
jgi:hypothetical protein